MQSSSDSTDLAILRAIATKADINSRSIRKNLARGLLASVTATVLLFIPMIIAGQQDVMVPMLNIKLPFPIASIAFWITSFGLGLSAAIRYRDNILSFKQIGSALPSLSDEEKNDFIKHYSELNQEYSLLMKPPGVLLVLSVYPLHILPCYAFWAFLVCLPEPGSSCSHGVLVVLSILGSLVTTGSYLYVGMSQIIYWALSRAAFAGQ